jgi:hypothetical protein
VIAAMVQAAVDIFEARELGTVRAGAVATGASAVAGAGATHVKAGALVMG